eukprot:TRINITY_DN8377_c0_g1_i2.p1 TRINITY_DN8377_c0_g1~~TRINITY_DN8377_c0_g1_i2.p1  ORF type:complete len:196 (+),score=26.07 TRINITY_DN8377_c0_g1_i2:106-693(+)
MVNRLKKLIEESPIPEPDVDRKKRSRGSTTPEVTITSSSPSSANPKKLRQSSNEDVGTNAGPISPQAGEPETKFGYFLKRIGEYECTVSELDHFNKKWKADDSFVLGRALFEKLPEELLLRISRQHCDITCKMEGDDQEFWITDTSGNGTYLNDKLIGKQSRMKLNSGDRIGILMVKPQHDKVEFGYIFALESIE